MLATLPLLQDTDFPAITRGPLETLQVNLGYRCNQQCLHCHVNAGPRRTEMMQHDTARQVLGFLEKRAGKITSLDLTGGAPELNPHFRELVTAARQLGIEVTDRCNLTILEETDQAGLAEFLAEHNVVITASLPCYLEENVEAQRGKGVFEKSIRALRRLNQLGYGEPSSGRMLNLVYNPQGPQLPPPQAALEADYRGVLREQFGIGFNQLFTLANMPIQRFGSMLLSKGGFDDYMQLLQSAHRDENLDGVMCRTLVSVDWKGYVYDCDFNQMLGLGLHLPGVARTHITDLMDLDLCGRPIVVAQHCYGCTAGQGSSCGGALG
jgi:radical SAM/Cys-rich protein